MDSPRLIEGHITSSSAQPALHASCALLLLHSWPDRIQHKTHQHGHRIDGYYATQTIEGDASARASTPP